MKVIFSVLALILATSAARADTVIPVESANFTVGVMGLGFNSESRTFSKVVCVQGSQESSRVIEVPMAPYTAKSILIEGNDVTVLFATNSRFHRVISLEGPYQKTSVSAAKCGDQFLKGTEIAGSVAVSKTFILKNAADAEALAGQLQQLRELKDLPNFKTNLSVSDTCLGVGGSEAPEYTAPLWNAVFGKKKSNNFVAIAYEVASHLDEHFPASRVANLVNASEIGQDADYGSTLNWLVSPQPAR